MAFTMAGVNSFDDRAVTSTNDFRHRLQALLAHRFGQNGHDILVQGFASSAYSPWFDPAPAMDRAESGMAASRCRAEIGRNSLALTTPRPRSGNASMVCITVSAPEPMTTMTRSACGSPW